MEEHPPVTRMMTSWIRQNIGFPVNLHYIKQMGNIKREQMHVQLIYYNTWIIY